MTSPIVTLTTDWSHSDFFSGKVKGRLYSTIEGVRVVDITYNVAPTDKLEAAFVAQNSCFDFPEGTIHIIDIRGQRAADTVVVLARGHFFIMTDNGMPSLIFGNDYERSLRVDNHFIPSEVRFMAYDVFCPLAAALAKGTALDEIGIDTPLQPAISYSYTSTPTSLNVYITYVDAYGDAYLGINFDDFERCREGRNFRMIVREHIITSIQPLDTEARTSSQVDLMLTVSSTGKLVLTSNQPVENASHLFGLQKKQLVKVNFL